MKYFLAIIAICCSGSSAAENWQPLAKMQSNEFYVDIDKVSGPTNARIINVKNNIIQGDQGGTSLGLVVSVNCIANEFTLIGAKAYKALNLQGDEVIARFESLNKTESIRPNTTSDLYKKIACDNGGSTKQSNQLNAKLKKLLSENWPQWDENTIQYSIDSEIKNIKKQNPLFTEDQVMVAVYDLWAKRAKEKNNPDIVRVNVPNSIQLATVHPKDPDFAYPIQNISICDKHCLSIGDYKKTCSLVKNLTYQAAMMSTVGGLDARLLERQGAVSDVALKWENNQCVMKFIVTGVFDGKKEGCRIYSIATAFAVGEPGGIVVNRAYPLSLYKDSTCRLY